MDLAVEKMGKSESEAWVETQKIQQQQLVRLELPAVILLHEVGQSAGPFAPEPPSLLSLSNHNSKTRELLVR